MIGKIRWVFIGITFAILKRLLKFRLIDDSAKWLQPLPFLLPQIVNREDFIVSICKNKSVLHIGFTDYPFTKEKIENNQLLHTKIKAVANFAFGIDNDEASIEEYKEYSGDNLVHNEDILQVYSNKTTDNNFDVIVFGEVAEHLQNPAKAIELIAKTFKPNTKLIVTVPNYTSLDSIAASLNKTESVHQHHYWYFSPFTLNKLVTDFNFTCEQMCFGMYYSAGVSINTVLKNNAFNGDCLIAVFNLNSTFNNE